MAVSYEAQTRALFEVARRERDPAAARRSESRPLALYLISSIQFPFGLFTNFHPDSYSTAPTSAIADRLSIHLYL